MATSNWLIKVTIGAFLLLASVNRARARARATLQQRSNYTRRQCCRVLCSEIYLFCCFRFRESFRCRLEFLPPDANLSRWNWWFVTWITLVVSAEYFGLRSLFWCLRVPETWVDSSAWMPLIISMEKSNSWNYLSDWFILWWTTWKKYKMYWEFQTDNSQTVGINKVWRW